MFLVYFAGELFSSKHLIGNAALAEAIAKVSNGNFECVLPQTLEARDATPRWIRDNDIMTLLECDLALFNFDGPELDSGTVAEFMLAKFADIPSLLLRSDFRHGGDQEEDPWNLMLSFYPRTRPLCLNSMEIYKEAVSTGSGPMQAAEQLKQTIAQRAVEELRILAKEPPVIAIGSAEPVFQWLAKMPGLSSPADEGRIIEAFARKTRNRTLA